MNPNEGDVGLKLVYLTSWHDANMKYDFHIDLNVIDVCCSFVGLTLLCRALKSEGLSLTELSVNILIPCLLKRKKKKSLPIRNIINHQLLLTLIPMTLLSKWSSSGWRACFCF